MRLPIYQVDAFSSRVFAGNPAAICPLEEWLPEDTMQAIAAENNLAETAFFVRRNGHFDLRWFTPACEVDLCGHATLASAYVLFTALGHTGETVQFQTKSGLLAVRRESELLVLNFPARPPQPVPPNSALLRALGSGEPLEVLMARDYLVRYRTEADVLAIQPDFAALAQVAPFGAIITAPGSDVDFVSRFFAPAKGVPEDPVTGSAHCTLIPYWADRLGKTTLQARQVSKRTGELTCRFLGDRVEMAGRAALYLQGEIHV